LRLDLSATSDLRPIALDQPYDVRRRELPFQPFSPDAARVVGVASGVATLLDAATGALIAHVPLAAADPQGLGVAAVAFAPDGHDLFVVPAVPDAKAFVRLDANGGVRARFDGFFGSLTNLVVLPEADQVVGEGSEDHLLHVWSSTGRLRYQIGDDDFPVSAFGATARGDAFLTLAAASWRAQAWPVLDVDAFARYACATLRDYLSVRTEAWAVDARTTCAEAGRE
jgi:hypothetical protein